MGDAAGIGPEIIVKALSHPRTYQFCSPTVIGSASVIQDALRFASCPLKIRCFDITRCSRLREIPPGETDNRSYQISNDNVTAGTIDVLDVVALDAARISVGIAHPLTGEAAAKSIQIAAQLALEKRIDAVVTAPICKAALHLAGYNYPGHTEIFAELTKASRVVMMLAGEKLRVSFVTTHLSLAQVPSQITVETILDVISVTHATLIRLGILSPKLVVAALNPHAGEAGAFGTEETEIIAPAVKAAQAAGYSVEGPMPADTLFVTAKDRRWDAVVAMYHDQGNIPLKLMEFGHIVNVTLGLPIIRTSVDHGTAFDIAGQGVASEASLIAALKFAAHLSRK